MREFIVKDAYISYITILDIITIYLERRGDDIAVDGIAQFVA